MLRNFSPRVVNNEVSKEKLAWRLGHFLSSRKSILYSFPFYDCFLSSVHISHCELSLSTFVRLVRPSSIVFVAFSFSILRYENSHNVRGPCHSVPGIHHFGSWVIKLILWSTLDAFEIRSESIESSRDKRIPTRYRIDCGDSTTQPVIKNRSWASHSKYTSQYAVKIYVSTYKMDK